MSIDKINYLEGPDLQLWQIRDYCFMAGEYCDRETEWVGPLSKFGYREIVVLPGTKR